MNHFELKGGELACEDTPLARIAEAVGPARDLVQAYCDVLEEKWYLSEQTGYDAGLAAAIDAYLALGAPAPEVVRGNDASSIGSDGEDPLAVVDPHDIDPLDVGDPAFDGELDEVAPSDR